MIDQLLQQTEDPVRVVPSYGSFILCLILGLMLEKLLENETIQSHYLLLAEVKAVYFELDLKLLSKLAYFCRRKSYVST